MEGLKEIPKEEVAQHNKEGDNWIIIGGVVYDVSSFGKIHPGGAGVLLTVAGKDATDEFYSLHKEAVLSKYKKLAIGRITGAQITPSRADNPGTLSKVPYSEPTPWQGWKSPYFKESHIKFRSAVRKIIESEISPRGAMWEESGNCPNKEIHQKLGKAGILAAMMGPGPHLKAIPLPGGVKPEEFDYFHEQIVHEEKAHIGLPSVQDGIGVGMVIGLPPVAIFGSPELKQKIVPEVVSGEKVICLAISEPYAGSDVANIRCTATKSPCGQFYIVNGVKKWITNGSFSDYFTTAVRTGGAGTGGVSVLLIERGPGVDTKKMSTSYGGAAGTAYITFDNVKVPVGNLLGKENEGFKIIMANFNHERWYIVAGVVSYSRLCVEEAFKWAVQRRVFGQPLINQPVIRDKIARMVSGVESVQAWLDNVTFQMTKMSYQEQTLKLASPIALLKLHSTRVMLLVGEQSCQVLGGRAITRTGMGDVVERFQRAVKYGAILGGSEEIMADLGIKQALKAWPKQARL